MFKNYNYLREIAEFIGHTYSKIAEFIRRAYSKWLGAHIQNGWARRSDRIGGFVPRGGKEAGHFWTS